MAIINETTKKGQALLARASVNLGKELRDVYGRWSNAKEDAMKDCREWCKLTNGRNFRIISANRYGFSVAWEYDNEETGEVMTRIETPFGTHIIYRARAKEIT